MRIQIDKNAPVPLYRQIIAEVRRLIDTGLLAAGTRLPSSRDLAEELDVSRKTILIATQELIADQYLESRPQSGIFVVDRTSLKKMQQRPSTSSQNDTSSDTGDLMMDWTPYDIPGDFFSLPPQRKATEQKSKPISFIKALPDSRLFPFEQIKQITQQLLWDPKAFFFDYGHPQGYQPLVEWLEKKEALSGTPMAPGQNDVVITSGFQQGLNLLVNLLLKPGDGVIVEMPTYAAILNLLIARKIPYYGVPVDANGMEVKKIEGIVKRHKIGAIFTIPTFHNPTGTVMSVARRKQLVDIAAANKIPIIEDSYAQDLRYDGAQVPTLKNLDKYGIVIRIGSFSKAFLPGLRLAWVTLPSKLAVPLVRMKRGVDRGDSFFLQVIMHEFILKGYLDKHLRRTRRIYKARRDALLEAMDEHFPKEITWTRPRGGFSLWVNLPKEVKSLALYHYCRERGVEFAVANFFWPGKQDASGFRLSWSLLEEGEIIDGAARLGKALKEVLADPHILDDLAKLYGEL
ncbi:MAG: PLP-dependent aminotransferase family protein [bacterium]|nr:PLP-dependent aminotransferase family protein [bacterium]